MVVSISSFLNIGRFPMKRRFIYPSYLARHFAWRPCPVFYSATYLVLFPPAEITFLLVEWGWLAGPHLMSRTIAGNVVTNHLSHGLLRVIPTH